MTRLASFALGVVLLSCGTRPPAREADDGTASPAPAATPHVDPCREGETWPGGLRPDLQGMARHVRCRAELIELMNATASALGVNCDHCHTDDYAVPTKKKQIANWMATQLAPSLRKRGGGAVGCADCHSAGGKARPKMLGTPRRHDLSVEWMTTVLVERFETAGGEPLYCRTCHVENVGAPGFVRSVILSSHLPPRGPSGAPPDVAGASSAAPPPAASPGE